MSYPRALPGENHGHFPGKTTGTSRDKPLVSTASSSDSWSRSAWITGITRPAQHVPRCSLRARGGSSPCSPCSRPQAGAARGCARVRSRRQTAPPLPSAARRGVLDGSGRGASRHSTLGLRPGSNKGLDKKANRLGRKAAQSRAGGSGLGGRELPSAGTPNRSRQPAWMTDPARLATGPQEPACCQSGTAARPKPEATATRTRLPTALIRKRDRLRLASRLCSSFKSPLTPVPSSPNLPCRLRL